MPRILSSGGNRTVVERFDTRSDTFASYGSGRRNTVSDLGLTPVGVYRSQVWVRACVETLALGQAMLPLKCYQRSADGDDRKRVRAEGSSLADLFSNPVPGKLSTMDFVEHIESELGIFNRAAALLTRPQPGAEPDVITPLYSERLMWHNGMWMYHTPDQGTFRFLDDEVITWRYYRGISPIETLADTLRLEYHAKQYSAASFENGIRPSGALIAPGIRDEEQKKALQAMLDARHAGSANNFRALVLTGDADWKSFNHTAKDAQLTDLRKLNRNEVATAYRIAPPLIGILDDATYSNIDTQYKMHFRITMGPRVKKFEETLRVKLIQKEPRWRNERLFMEFDMDAVLRASLAERADAYVKMIQVGYTINGIRQLENLPALDHPLADTAFFPVNLRPVSDEAFTLGASAPALAARAIETRSATNGHAKISDDGLLNLVSGVLEHDQ